MQQIERQGELYLEGEPVGTIIMRRMTPSWGFGYFTPQRAFSKFALLFGVWSLMIHADDGRSQNSPAALEALRAAEIAIDRIHSEIRWKHSPIPVQVRQVTIDGKLIEWHFT